MTLICRPSVPLLSGVWFAFIMLGPLQQLIFFEHPKPQLLGAMLQAGNSAADPGNATGTPSGLKMV